MFEKHGTTWEVTRRNRGEEQTASHEEDKVHKTSLALFRFGLHTRVSQLALTNDENGLNAPPRYRQSPR